MRDGQEIAQALAARLPASTRASLEGPPNTTATGDQAVRERCQALLEMNRASLSTRGDGAGATSQAFMSRCQGLGMETWRCLDRGEEGRNDPECRRPLASVDREVRQLREEGRDTAHPPERIDTLVADPWETEREAVSPETLGPDDVEPDHEGTAPPGSPQG